MQGMADVENLTWHGYERPSQEGLTERAQGQSLMPYSLQPRPTPDDPAVLK